MPSHLNSIVLGVVIQNQERKSTTRNILNHNLKRSIFQNTNGIADIWIHEATLMHEWKVLLIISAKDVETFTIFSSRFYRRVIIQDSRNVERKKCEISQAWLMEYVYTSRIFFYALFLWNVWKCVLYRLLDVDGITKRPSFIHRHIFISVPVRICHLLR